MGDAATEKGLPGPAAARRPLPGLDRAAAWALAAAAAGVLAAAAFAALARLDDWYGIGHVPGTWMALAAEVLEGRLYPPLFDDGYFAGTRYLPLPILVYAGGAGLTGEYVVSGKVLALLGTAAVLVLTWLVLRRVVGCRPSVSLGLTATVLATPTGMLSATSYRGDALPVALQLGALALVTRSTPAAAGAAGALAGLALVSKLSAIWALAAGALWLGLADRRLLARFVLAAAGTAVGILAVAELASAGRMSDDLLELTFAGDADQTRSPLAAASVAAQLVPATTWLVAALAAVALVLAVRARRLSVWQLALLVESALLLVVFTDVGSDFNHLLDVTVLVAIVAGEAWRALAPRRAWVAPALAAVLAVGLLAGLGRSVGPETVEAARAVAGEPRKPPLRLADVRRYVASDTSVLSEHPGLEVALGRRPRVLDPFMLIRLEEVEPAKVAALVRQLRAGEIDHVLLLLPLAESREHYLRTSFGASVADAIEASYRPVRLLGTPPYAVWVYAPAAAARR